MRPYYLAIILASIAVVFAGVWYGLDITNNSGTVYTPKFASTISASQIESSAIPQNMADANNAFAVDMYKQIASGEGKSKNIFFSPSSIQMAFSIIYEGANGDTAQQLQDVMYLESDTALRHNSTAHALAYLNQDDPYVILEMANAIWIKNNVTLYPQYLDILRGTYLADVENISFDDTGAKKINQWASDKTRGNIKQVTEKFNSIDVMMITNAIYFKGIWSQQFDPSNTTKHNFWTNESTHTVASFITKTETSFDYINSDDVQVLKMPYEGDRLSMLVILPDERDGISQLEESLSIQQIQKWNDDMVSTFVHVSIPKFETRTNYNLIEQLRDMGVTDLFDEHKSNLYDIGNGLYVSSSSHDAYIKVNEEGTEAAAVTLNGIAPVGSINSAVFVADHPFIFLIQDNASGAILFMGRIMDPIK